MLEICNEKEKASLYFSVQDDGIGIEEAYDGQQALERIRQSKEGEYDLILMDIMMPVMAGLEAAREIRKLPRDDCKTLPIVAMSANAFDEDVKKSLATGLVQSVTKCLVMRHVQQNLIQRKFQHLNMHTKPLPRQREPHVQKKGIEHIGIVKIVDYILQIKMA